MVSTISKMLALRFPILILSCLQIKESVQFSALVINPPHNLVEISWEPACLRPPKAHHPSAYSKRRRRLCESSCVLDGAFYSICNKNRTPVQFFGADGCARGVSFVNPQDKRRIGGHCSRDPSHQDLADDCLPKWALCPPGTPLDTFHLDPQHRRCTVRITNPYISWEPFHARLVPSSPTPPAVAAAVRVDPARGVLAPRGGANNACDATKPYPDSCTLALTLACPPPRPDDAVVPEGGQEEVLQLVVCLEQCSWTWEVRVG
jgi:hypothetical protein